jgi:hypothetical protein
MSQPLSAAQVSQLAIDHGGATHRAIDPECPTCGWLATLDELARRPPNVNLISTGDLIQTLLSRAPATVIVQEYQQHGRFTPQVTLGGSMATCLGLAHFALGFCSHSLMASTMPMPPGSAGLPE